MCDSYIRRYESPWNSETLNNWILILIFIFDEFKSFLFFVFSHQEKEICSAAGPLSGAILPQSSVKMFVDNTC